ncbi:MAG TPA: choice-of-anchor D domain-containing protein [Terracidiphilus sp.]|nr:choice-of-anchor D domain-containing protein [Terracidiphilus sp.]
MQTKALQQLVKAAMLPAAMMAFAVLSAFCGQGSNPGGGLSATSEAFGSQVIDSPQTAALTGTGIVPAKLLPTSPDFGRVLQSTASAAKTITLYNEQAVPLAITSIATGNPDFTEVNTCGESLAAKSHCAITVTFTPSMIGAETATLSVTDAASNSPQTAALTGTGIAPAKFSPGALTFAAQIAGTTSAAKSVTLTNNLSTPLPISITFAGADPGDFAQANTCGSSLAAGANCTIAVMFTPSASGTRMAALNIEDHGGASPQTVSVSGTGRSTGQTYHVDNCVVIGSDANNGTSTATPWLTVNKVNTSTFNPGDSILFERTCTWREQLAVPSSGAAGSPITLGAYGTGAKPIISGADIFSSWITEGSLYYSAAPVQPNQVFMSGVRLTAVAAKASLATGDWWWDSTHSRIYVYDNPGGHTIEASQRYVAIAVSGVAYIALSNLQTQEAQTDGVDITEGSSRISVSGVLSQNNFTEGIQVYEAPNSSVVSSTVAYNGAHGILSENSADLLIDRCVAHHNAQLTAEDWTAGIYVYGTLSTGVTIQNSESYSNGTGQPDYRGGGIWPDTVGSGLIVRNNFVYSNNLTGIIIDADNESIVDYNVVFNNGLTAPAGGAAWDTVGIFVFADANASMTRQVIYNNTVYGNAGGGIEVEGPSAGSSTAGCMNNVVTNNIAVNTLSGPNFAAYNGCENPGKDGSGNVYSYNDFGTQANNFIEWGAGAFYSTYATWETAAGNCGAPGCSHSVQADPQFVNAAAAQFWLQSGSPAIEAGIDLGSPYNIGLLPASSWPNSVVTGDQNSYGTGWEVGAYIFTGQTVQ